jgi:hypothetical protein
LKLSYTWFFIGYWILNGAEFLFSPFLLPAHEIDFNFSAYYFPHQYLLRLLIVTFNNLLFLYQEEKMQSCKNYRVYLTRAVVSFAICAICTLYFYL